MTQETIYAAAIRHKGTVHAMRPPNRHHGIIERIHMMTGEYDQDAVQGFITNEGRFVDRVEAAKIALESGQIEKLKFQKDELFTEDLW